MTASTDVVVGRQAIFDRQMAVVGYELLFRSQPDSVTAEGGVDGGLMTAAVLYSSISVGIDNLVGGKVMFCNADEAALTGRIPILLPPDRTVVEILENVEVTNEVIEGCRSLRAAGFELALDDFQWFAGAEPLLELASIVKVDLTLTALEDIPALMDKCRPYGVSLLAEKIETDDELAACQALEFDYFQGYGLERPAIVVGRTLSGTELTAASLSGKLLGTELEIEELEEILSVDPGLIYQILKLAGSGSRHGLRRPVRTFREALLLLGAARTQSWLALLLLRSHGAATDQNITDSLIRSKMCELLVQRRSRALAPIAFTAGMLSSFDRLLRVERSAVLDALDVDDELLEAAFGTRGVVARVLHDVVAHLDDPMGAPERLETTTTELDLAYVEALGWAEQSMHRIG